MEPSSKPQSSRCEVILHLGTHKTGSTAIQGFFYNNREILQIKHRILYPETGILAPAHHLIAFAARNRTPGGRHTPNINGIEEYMNDISMEVDKYNPKKMIISSEAFLPSFDLKKDFVDPCILKKMLADHPVRVIVYLRPQWERVVSSYKQFVKSRFWQFSGDLKKFAKTWAPTVNYLRVLRPWRAAFGSDSIMIRPYNPSRWFRGNIIDDFANTAGMNLSGINAGKKKIRNASHSLLATEILRVLNSNDIGEPIAEAEISDVLSAYDNQFSKIMKEEFEKEFFDNNKEIIDRLKRRFEDSNAKLIEKYDLDPDFWDFQTETSGDAPGCRQS